ncbi:MAG: NAD(P)-dependent alcohol dehydrogenase [Tetrasphaera sp.]
MRALVLSAWKTRPELVELPDPEPGPGEVVLKIGGAGCCHSDVHLYNEFEAGVVPWNPPFVLGHENAGWVHALGAGVKSVDEGAAYLVYGPTGCGLCPPCLEGFETYCERAAELPAAVGLGRDGGMAEFMTVPARHLVPIGDLDPALAAPLADAGLTPYHAIKRALPYLGVGGSYALAIGLGGLGQVGVQILKALTGAVVIAVDAKPEALTLATENAADHVVAAGADAAAQVRELTGGRGCDAVFDFVGATPTMELAVASAKHRSAVTIVGIGGGSVAVSFFTVPYECNLATTYWGSLPELTEVVAMARCGQIRPSIQRFGLDQAGEAYRQLEEGALTARAVVVP